MSYYILDENGEAVETDLIGWSDWYADFNRRLIKRTEVGRFVVITIFEGLDPDNPWRKPPYLWESAAFDLRKDGTIGAAHRMQRANSREAALKLHAAFVEEMKKK